MFVQSFILSKSGVQPSSVRDSYDHGLSNRPAAPLADDAIRLTSPPINITR